MTLQSSGQIALSDIQTEYSRTDPNLKAYYGASTGIPTSGRIGIKDFYGASSVPPFDGVLIDNLLVNKQTLLEPDTLNWLKTPITKINAQWDIKIDGIWCQAKCWNLPINQTNVNNGSGGIIDMSRSAWQANGTRFLITQDPNGYLGELFDMGYMANNQDSAIYTSTHAPVPHIENNTGTHFTFYSLGTFAGGILVEDMNYSHKSDLIVRPRTGATPWGQRLTLSQTRYIYLANGVTGLVDVLLYTKPPIVSGYAGHNVQVQLISMSGTNIVKKETYCTPYVYKHNNMIWPESLINHNIIGYLQQASLSTTSNQSLVPKRPNDEHTRAYNRYNSLAARVSLASISNDGSISVNDQVTAHSGSTYSDWCSRNIGYDGKHWNRGVSWLTAGVTGRCWAGSASNVDYIYGRTVSNFKLTTF
jgi:hypothetical protein